MADVMQKAINANDIKRGYVVIKTGGGKGILSYAGVPGLQTLDTAAQVEAKLTDRMDDPRYYSGDTTA